MLLVSYGAWPGDQGRFYSREAEPRVPASRRDAAAARKGGREGERRAEERRKRERERGKTRGEEARAQGARVACEGRQRGTREVRRER